ncbi:hypothetical protein PYW07_010060 [Mythimna separata]|uniref:Peptidase S1 domain-containing protein n=1 Tax=Mythimna separata TaxID=271217 RepID=A0AAD8DRD1_MYTSE|nr:hypothetical protein PYW07_010060 [Mythimna separata]
MFKIKFSCHLLLLYSIFQVTWCDRRIVDGQVVTAEKSYAVYLVKAKESVQTYDTWLCGGAIVTKWFIVTSAACVEDVQFMYAIAGYRKYVSDKNIEKDQCTKKMKKKIIYRCIPISYEFDFKKIEKWAYVDIALVKVESPYDFNDVTYQIICSYIPSRIPINYDERRQATNTDALMLGWGHSYSWREQNDDDNHNSDTLQFGSTTLYDKTLCAREYSDYPELSKIIQKYMICTLASGHVNDHGVPYSMGKPRSKKHSCITKEMKEAGQPGEVCDETINKYDDEVDGEKEDDEDPLKLMPSDGRKRMETSDNITNYQDNGTDSVNTTDVTNGTDDAANRRGSISGADYFYKLGVGNVTGIFNRTYRRSGICQNDHGGPLVSWVGKKEVLIGIASVFKISASNQCIGPYLFTSTMCNGAFLGCVLGDQSFLRKRSGNANESTRTAQFCNSPPSVRGFDTIESYVSWKNHPAGPADNEKSMLRSKPKEKDDSKEQFLDFFNEKDKQLINLPNVTPKKEEEEPNDMFSSNIGIPPRAKPAARKRPLLRKRRPPTSPPSERESLPRMSVRPETNIIWFFIFIPVSNCQRRIEHGLKVTSDKPYVVYLVKAARSIVKYDYWLCGGALVTTDFVVTSAACIRDVDYMYVIAGYNKYVTDAEIETDACTRDKKKKVIYTCYPEGYDLRYDRLDKWSFIDIGVARVESPYDFTDQSFKKICSYIPGTIPINTEDKYQRPGMDAIVLGWGHRIHWRKPEDKQNYNEKDLNYASVIIINKNSCKEYYEGYGTMEDVISSYMICTLGDGSIDENGIPLATTGQVLSYGCSRRKSMANNSDVNLEDCEYDDGDETRRRAKKSRNVTMTKITTENNFKKTTANTNITTVSKETGFTESLAVTDRTALSNGTGSSQKSFIHNKTHNFDETVRDTRRNGICQNDHGGPLVTWIGSHEILIGVASVFKVTNDYVCQGPFLYTSTQCNGGFLDCVLGKTDFHDIDLEGLRRSYSNVTDNSSRRSYCRKSPNDKRHLTTERHISWLHHPAGAADHERHLIQKKNKPEPVKEQVPVRNEENKNKNGMSINKENEQYPPIQNNQKSSVNVDNAPNKKYIFSENVAPIVNQHGAPNNEYAANYQYPPSNIPGMINNKNAPYSVPVSNNGAASNKGPASNNEAASNKGPTSNNGAPSNNGPALRYQPVKYKTEWNNNPDLRNGPVLNNQYYDRNNNQGLNNGPPSVINPKPIYKNAASKILKMRPTRPFRI